MKTIKFLATLFVTIIISVGFMACSSSEDDSNDSASIVGSVWEGYTTYGYDIEVEITSSTKCEITLSSSGGSYMGNETSTYTYDSTTGMFTTTYKNMDISGKISGNVMTVTDYDGTYDLKRTDNEQPTQESMAGYQKITFTVTGDDLSGVNKSMSVYGFFGSEYNADALFLDDVQINTFTDEVNMLTYGSSSNKTQHYVIFNIPESRVNTNMTFDIRDADATSAYARIIFSSADGKNHNFTVTAKCTANGHDMGTHTRKFTLTATNSQVIKVSSLNN